MSCGIEFFLVYSLVYFVVSMIKFYWYWDRRVVGKEEVFYKFMVK